MLTRSVWVRAIILLYFLTFRLSSKSCPESVILNQSDTAVELRFSKDAKLISQVCGPYSHIAYLGISPEV